MWLTWQGIRDLATSEAHTDGTSVRYVPPWRSRTIRMIKGRPVSDLPSIAPGPLVYSRDTWRAPWRSSLAQVSRPCVLLTSYTDWEVQSHATTGLLDGTNIRKWFTVQCATTHPNLIPMPIGIDGRDLPSFLKTEPAEKDTWLYLNFQPRTDERRELLTHFAPHSWVKTEPWRTVIASSAVGYGPSISIAAYCRELARARFVLSPMGRAWDCYRTYEAMVMGAIPIVKRQSPQSQVLTGLPALIVDDWREVTRSLLERTWANRSPPNLERITLQYWKTRVESCAARL